MDWLGKCVIDKIKGMRKLKLIKTTFNALVGVFVMVVGWMIISAFVPMERVFFLSMMVLILPFFLLGLVLVFLTIKRGVKGKLKGFLILTGSSASGFLIGVLLHNFLYGLGMVFNHISWLYSLMEVLHVAFFLMAVLVCPLSFLVGVVGSVIIFNKKKK